MYQKVDTVQKLLDQGILKNGMRVLDVGCGQGNWAWTMKELGLDILYTGLDAQAFYILKAMEKVNDPSYEFRHIDVQNTMYNPMGRVRATEIKLPIASHTIDLCICHSLFTHLGHFDNAKAYIEEVHRVLKSAGKLWITFFQSPPNEVSNGLKRTVYTAEQIDQLLDRFTVWNKFGGHSTDYNDQLMIEASKI